MVQTKFRNTRKGWRYIFLSNRIERTLSCMENLALCFVLTTEACSVSALFQ